MSLEDCLKKINDLEGELAKKDTIVENLEKDQKDSRYKFSSLVEEMKNQKARLDREAEKSKVRFFRRRRFLTGPLYSI